MSSDLRIPLSPPADPEYVKASYAEICKSHQALDDFRMKLLGLLPIASVVGLLTLEQSGLAAVGTQVTRNEIVAYVGLFAAMFTLALFVYEMRNILICHDLIMSGRSLEQVMNVPGQFNVCGEQRQLPCYTGRSRRRIAQKLNAKLAASGIYSLVFSAWLFVALRYGFAVGALTCALCAVVVGLILACGSYALLHFLVSGEDADVVDEAMPAASLAVR